jgi:hypothetical protein
MAEPEDLSVDVQKIDYKGAHVATDGDGKRMLILMTRPKPDSNFRNHPMGIPLNQAVMLRRRLNELHDESGWFQEAEEQVEHLKEAWQRQEPAE